jgi:hypothetical protein
VIEAGKSETPVKREWERKTDRAEKRKRWARVKIDERDICSPQMLRREVVHL